MFFKKLKSLNVLLLNVSLLLIAFHGNDLRAQTYDVVPTSEALFKSRQSAEDFVFNRLTKSSNGELSPSDRFLVALNSNKTGNPVSVKQQLEITIEYAAHVVDALSAYGIIERRMGEVTRLKDYKDVFKKALSAGAGVGKYPEEVRKLLNNKPLPLDADLWIDDYKCTSFFCHVYNLRGETETEESFFNGVPNQSPGEFALVIVDKVLVFQEVKVDRWQLQAKQRRRLTQQQNTERQTAVRCLGWDSASPPNCIGGWM
jgi:hypothetical protein